MPYLTLPKVPSPMVLPMMKSPIFLLPALDSMMVARWQKNSLQYQQYLNLLLKALTCIQIKMANNSLANQNLRLLQAIHSEIPFLKRFSGEQLTQLSAKSHFFVFSNGTVIAQEKEPIDFVAVVLEGKVGVSGDGDKRSAGYFIGELGFCGILDRHAVCIVGDSDGIVMAIKLEDIAKMSKDIRDTINSFCVAKSIETLKNINQPDSIYIPEQIEERKVSHLFSPTLKILLNQTLDLKEKQTLFKFFPVLHITAKTKIVQKKDQPFLLALVKGELVIKSETGESASLTKIMPGQIYNTEGFLLNYSPQVNIYCLSEEAVVIKIWRRQLVNLFDMGSVQKIDNFLLRKQINDKKYEVITSEIRREKEKQMTKTGNANTKWTVFTKQNYEIIPLSLPKKEKQKEKPKTPSDSQQKQQFISTLFRQQIQQQSKNQKTNTSTNSKINKIITMKTEKAQEKTNTLEQQVKDMRKQMEILSSKLKYYEDNFNRANLEMIEYRAKYQMNAVFKEINELGDKRFRNKSGTEMAKVMTLKKAFEEHMKENRIMEVVARCAYKWLWTVRKKKGLKKFRSTVK